MEWFLEHRPDLTDNVASMHAPGSGERRLLSLVDADQLRRILARRCSTSASSSRRYGIRALSRVHAERPVRAATSTATDHVVDYEPAESTTGLFGGNSNWRGPIWFPAELPAHRVAAEVPLLSTATTSLVECPTGSGRMLTLWEVATELSQRLSSIFLRRRRTAAPSYGDAANGSSTIRTGATSILFHEYFHGDNGAGLGASHQTGLDGARRQAAASRAANSSRE